MSDLNINEEKRILTAASLNGKDAPETLSKERANLFVASKLGNASGQSERLWLRPVYLWGSIALAAASICAVSIILFRPSPSGPYGLTPVELSSAHASSEVADSVSVVDSVELTVIESEVIE